MQEPQVFHPFSGEFLDQELEVRYRYSVQARTVQQLRNSLLVVAALYVIFGPVVDYQMMGVTMNFWLLLTMRIMVSLACVALALALKRYPGMADWGLPLNLVSFLFITSCIFIVPLRPETLNTQLTTVVAVTITLYLFVPNRIPWVVALCVYLGVGFLLAIHFSSDLPFPRLMLIGLVLVMPNIIGLMTALRLNRLQREQFASLLAEREANRQLQKEIEERERLEEELRHQAQVDDLTGLNNRRWFLELARQELRHTRRMGIPMTLCMVDLDHFKAVNDNKGHAAGDKVLAIVAALCRKELREMDIIGRFGGEEFIIALPNSDSANAYAIAERLRMKTAAIRLPDELTSLLLTVTIGIAQVESSEETLESALLRADQALYRGKREGRNRVIVAEGSGGMRETQEAPP